MITLMPTKGVEVDQYRGAEDVEASGR